jgi:glutathione S-transferase
VLLHLAERDPQRRLLPRDERQRAEVLSWLFWQVVSGAACGTLSAVSPKASIQRPPSERVFPSDVPS